MAIRIFTRFLFFSFLISSGYQNNPDKSFTVWTEPNTGIEFILIPKGTFMMGDLSLSDSFSTYTTPHLVNISKDIWMSRKEITLSQWQKIMGTKEMHPEKPSPFGSENPNYPVVSVSFYDVQSYLEKLNLLTGKNQFRLPTEAEWEYACRAGTRTPFSTGTEITDSQANFNAEFESTFSPPGKYIGHSSPVGSYPPNNWGLYDLHGNVWEWVNDWYAPFSHEKIIDPKGPVDGKFKVIRGGSWYFGAKNAQSFCRKTHEPNLWGFSIGFRLACDSITSD